MMESKFLAILQARDEVKLISSRIDTSILWILGSPLIIGGLLTSNSKIKPKPHTIVK